VLAAGIVFLLAILTVAAIFPPALWLFVADLCLSLATIALYAWDKAAARGNRRRIPEIQLQILSLAGGWPGAAVAQSLFRHKTQKRDFQRTFKAMATLNVLLTVSALGLLFTSYR
jgi:uncharacterized membrane protein YsdA (DUF1294 family)